MTALDQPLLPLALVAAFAKNRVIGKGNAIPWHIPEDSKHFRTVTLGHAVIMGRATYDSIGKPLPKRRNIVVSRNRELRIEGVEVVASLSEALELARQNDDEPRIAGGAQIYAESLALVTRMYLTELDDEYDGDTKFPEFDATQWHEVERRRGERLTYMTLERR